MSPPFSRLPPLSLYVHLPWCARKCPYCDFNSHESRGTLPEDEYVAALLADPDIAGPAAQGRELRTIFIGGGTPSLFSAAAVGRLLEGIARRLGVSVELAERRLAVARERLRAARAARPVPHIDRTRYTNWNGMLAGAMIRAGTCHDLPRAMDHGLNTLRRMREEQADPAALTHRSGGPGGMLDDQVQVALAALEAHEATGVGAWLEPL